jgi:hypothetical protein
VYVYNLIFSSFIVFCEGAEDAPTAALPQILEFGDLHLSECLKAAITTLKGVSGIYAIIHISTGRVYIGSSRNIGLRLMTHLVYGSCNPHLQNALALYGLSMFLVALVQEYTWDPDLTEDENAANLLAQEQVWLDWLFSLPADFRYNFNPIADCPPDTTGTVHSDKTKAKISAAMLGVNSLAVSVYDLQGNFVSEFPTRVEAGL